ncbi:XRE family transcriptional regulator [Fulvivirgaceae bacterium BMA12]|uniref:XRE family transcriptional regulator n=1 Tax=Agaribacillus aureus TaxID=3051825 RepID=A0ABT8L9I8_9BACT|nr:XRE family transcriptional regulator [Fulvivirgaceae bacterium BMA12]
MFKDDSLSNIGKRIKEERRRKGLSLQELGKLSGVTAGLLSKIENFRAVASLPVLFNIAKSLEVKMSELVEDVKNDKEFSFLLIRNNEGIIEEREDSVGLVYESLIHQDIGNINFRTNIVRVMPNTYREPIATDAMESIYVVSGSVTYGIGDNEILLNQGDTFYFDGSFPHSVRNDLEVEAVLFKIYLLKLNGA